MRFSNIIKFFHCVQEKWLALTEPWSHWEALMTPSWQFRRLQEFNVYYVFYTPDVLSSAHTISFSTTSSPNIPPFSKTPPIQNF